MTAGLVKLLAADAGFDLCGIANALPLPDFNRFLQWAEQGHAARMGYLTDRRAHIRQDPRRLLPSAQSIICVAKVYNGPEPTTLNSANTGWISRYAWGRDYHQVLRNGLERLVTSLQNESGSFEYKICVDTAPLLERSYARAAGLGWIGRNTCLINESKGSWLFLGELLVSIRLETDTPAEDRCGSCTRCIDACPTDAFLPHPSGDGFLLDSWKCISYLTIEHKGSIPEPERAAMGTHLFGCDICQDVCPWNQNAPVHDDPAFCARELTPALDPIAALDPEAFRRRFDQSPVLRTRHSGLLRNAAVAMGNSRDPRHRPALLRLADSPDANVREHAEWALGQLV